MTDNAVLMVDLSSNNGPVDLKKHYVAGYRTLALKATESTSYVWADHGRLADQWHKLGGNVWHYHFGRPGNPKAQARYFLSAVAGHWKAGDRLTLDAEVQGVDAAFVVTFIDTCHAAFPDRPGVVYSYSSFLTAAHIKPAHGWGLWLAAYGTVKPKPVPGWTSLLAWQHTDKATGVPGISGKVDQSYLYDVKPPLTPEQRRLLRDRLLVLHRRIKHIRHRLGRKP